MRFLRFLKIMTGCLILSSVLVFLLYQNDKISDKHLNIKLICICEINHIAMGGIILYITELNLLFY